MNLSTDLIDQFVTVTNNEPKEPKETTVYGTVVKNGNDIKVRLDGSSEEFDATPVVTTTNVEDGQRVTVLIKNHTATITGNIDDPAAGTYQVASALGTKLSVDELTASTAFIGNLIAGNISTESLDAVKATIGELIAGEITAEEAEIRHATIEELEAGWAEMVTANIGKAIVNNLTASYAYVNNLDADYGEFKTLVAEEFAARDATIENLGVTKLDVTTAEMEYANINFANITDLAVQKIFGGTGLIDNLTVGDGMVVTGDLAVVTLNADNIKSGTMTADRLLLKGADDGLYYQLNLNALGETYVTDLTEEEQQELQNGIHGENIIAHSIVAKHISVDDLTAFGATIANFKITTLSPENLLTSPAADRIESVDSHRKLDVINANDLDIGAKYTLSFDGTLPSDSTSWLLRVVVLDRDDNAEFVDFITDFKYENRRWVGTGEYPDLPDGYVYTQLRLYPMPYATQHADAAYTEYIKLEPGNSATDWQPGPGRLYSDAKSSPDNDTRGIYMDTDGQFAVGDSNAYLKLFYNDEGESTLALKTSRIELENGKTVEEAVDDINAGKNLFLNSGRLQDATLTPLNVSSYGFFTADRIIIDGGSVPFPSNNFLECTFDSDDNHAQPVISFSYLNYNNKIKAGDTVTISMYFAFSRETEYTPGYGCPFIGNDYRYINRPALGTNWQRLVMTGVVVRDTDGAGTPEAMSINFLLAGTSSSDEMKIQAGDKFYLSSPKIELGHKATAWTWATESNDVDINNAINDINIGARNLLTAATAQNPKSNNAARHRILNFHENVTLVPDMEYTLSFIGELPQDSTNWQLNIETYDENGTLLDSSVSKFITNFKLVNGRWVGTGKCPAGHSYGSAILYAMPHPGAGNVHDSNATTSYFKLEVGNKATDWSPAPEDFDAKLNAAWQEDHDKLVANATTIYNIERLLKGEYDSDNEIYKGYKNIYTSLNSLTGTESTVYVTDGSTKNSKDIMLSEASGQGLMVAFANGVSDVLRGMRDDTKSAVDLAGRIELKKDEFDDAYISISPAEEGCKLKLTADDIEFINKDDRITAVLTSDESDSLQTDNVTIGNELRQAYGSRNLLTKATAEANVSSTDSHRKLRVHDSDKLEAGKKYTLSFEGTLPSKDYTGWLLRVDALDSDGNEKFIDFITRFKLVNGRWFGTGKYPDLDGYTYSQLRLYPMPYSQTHTNSFSTEAIKLESGSKATEFSLAPEDSNAPSGYFVWEVRSNGNYGISWKGD